MSAEILIRVEGAGKRFCRDLQRSLFYGLQDIAAEFLLRSGDRAELRPKEFWALGDVSFEVRRGECLALLGRNGAGKTTLLKLLNGLIKPDQGRVLIGGRVGALIALGAGFNPVLTGRENVYVNAAVLGISKRDIDRRLDEIIAFAEMQEFIDAPVQSYSSGMQMRLGFAVATAIKPDVLLLDEVLAVGDTSFRMRCFQRIGEIIKDTAVVFVSHDVVQVARICNRALVLKSGRCHFMGEIGAALDAYAALAEGGEPARPTVLRHPAVKEMTCTVENLMIQAGQSARIVLTFDMSHRLVPGLGLFALYANEMAHVQGEFTALLPEVPAGRSCFTADFGPLHLRKGRYHLAVTLMDESRKIPIVHGLNLATLDVCGDSGYGVSYLAPVSIVTKSDKRE